MEPEAEHRPLDGVMRALLARHGDPGDGLFVVASSASMAPMFRDGDILTVQADNFEELKPGAVVLRRKSGRLVAHRLIEMDYAGRLILCGDSLLSRDEPLAAKDVVGKVCGVIRGGRYFVLRRSWAGRAAAWLSRLVLAKPWGLRGWRSMRRWTLKALALAVGPA